MSTNGIEKGRRSAVLTALFVTGYSAFVNLYATQPLLPHFREIFDAPEWMVSLTVSMPVFAVAVAAPFFGSIADLLGRKRVIVASLFGMAIPTMLAGTASNLSQLIFWRFLQGFFTPGIVAVVMAYVSEETEHNLVGSTMAYYLSGAVFGGFCGRLTSGIVAEHWNWKASMVTLGAATVIGALLTWILLPRSRKFVPHNDFAETLASMKVHIRNPQLLATYAVGFNVLFCLVGVFTYVNFYLADPPFHLGPAALSWMFAVYLIGSIVTPASGRLMDRMGCRHIMMGAAALAATGVLLTLIRWVPMVIAGLALSATGAFVSQVAASSYVGKVAGQARSSAAGLYVCFYYLGGGMGSFLPGLFWKWTGWTGCVGLVIALQVFIAWIAHSVWKTRAQELSPPTEFE